MGSRQVTAWKPRTPRAGNESLDVVDLLVKILRPTIALPGCACLGKPELFDPDAEEEHHAQARQICATCPARQACLAWSSERTDTVSGILGGLLLTGPKVSRPRKRTTA